MYVWLISTSGSWCTRPKPADKSTSSRLVTSHSQGRRKQSFWLALRWRDIPCLLLPLGGELGIVARVAD